MTTSTDGVDPLSLALITLMKGVTYAEDDAPRWQSIVELAPRIREYIGLMGLELVLDEGERYAFLRQRDYPEGEPELPRLVPRRPLTYRISLLLVLLRKKLMELDNAGGDTRLIVGVDDLVELIRVHHPAISNEAKLVEDTGGAAKKLVEMGFLKKMRGDDERFEVRRILKSFVDAQWAADFDDRLSEYLTQEQVK
jgi:hypothetical protein